MVPVPMMYEFSWCHMKPTIHTVVAILGLRRTLAIQQMPNLQQLYRGNLNNNPKMIYFIKILHLDLVVVETAHLNKRLLRLKMQIMTL